MSVWDNIDPWDRNQVREKREEIWEGSYVTNRAKAQAAARGTGYPGMWKCSGCSRTFADEWAWYCHVSAEEKATMVSKKRPWSLLCLGPSVEKVREWEQEREQRERARNRWQGRDGGKGDGGKVGQGGRNPASRSRSRSRSQRRQVGRSASHRHAGARRPGSSRTGGRERRFEHCDGRPAPRRRRR